MSFEMWADEFVLNVSRSARSTLQISNGKLHEENSREKAHQDSGMEGLFSYWKDAKKFGELNTDTTQRLLSV